MLAYSLYIVCNDVKHTQHVFNRGSNGSNYAGRENFINYLKLLKFNLEAVLTA